MVEADPIELLPTPSDGSWHFISPSAELPSELVDGSWHFVSPPAEFPLSELVDGSWHFVSPVTRRGGIYRDGAIHLS